MKTAHTVGDLARLAGLPASTIRYYDRRGLLKPAERTEGNYRIYDTDALDRLAFIRAAVSNGFTLEDIETLLAFRDGESRACRKVQGLIEDRLKELQIRARELARVQVALRSLLRQCRATERSGKCQAIERLGDKSQPTAARLPRRSQAKDNSKKSPT